MNLFELKIVLRQLRQDLKCPSCEAMYAERKIEIVGTTHETGLFVANCKECSESIIINVHIERKHRRISARNKNYWKMGDSISSDEVLDMHNFLQNFNGNIDSLIKINE
ncbi:MAG: hypothetical protein Q8P68_06095 [Candidatus Peregrinibacteria bacterium]|nr:hypothetical protein [Candidatus Peregrinibacteria bacterium]MDZ4244771.1 hypothetical protein [Candidatus Gracilibacteria bacterium]